MPGQDSLLICSECGEGKNAELGDDEVCFSKIVNPDYKCGSERRVRRGIEVGHTFLLGDRYSRVMKAKYKTDSGSGELYQMGCYGIGVSRLLAASLEVQSSSSELRWPVSIAPFSTIILAPKAGSKEAAAGGLLDHVHDKLEKIFRDDVMVDDRDKLTVGRKLREARKTGYPYIVLFGKKSVDSDPRLELHIVNTGEMIELRPSELVEYMMSRHSDMLV